MPVLTLVNTEAVEPAGAWAIAVVWTAIIAVTTCAGDNGVLVPEGVKLIWALEPEGVAPVMPPMVAPIRGELPVIVMNVGPVGVMTSCVMLATV